MNELFINTKNQVIPANIVFFKADINYSIAYYADGKKKVIVKTLKHIESQLVDHGFYRIHKSFLVNLEYISHNPSGKNLIVSNIELSISRRKLSGLRRKLKTKHKNS